MPCWLSPGETYRVEVGGSVCEKIILGRAKVEKRRHRHGQPKKDNFLAVVFFWLPEHFLPKGDPKLKS